MINVKPFDDPRALNVGAAMGDQIDAMGLQAIEKSGVKPFDDPRETLLAICRLACSNEKVSPQYAIDIYRMIRTLMEHGLTGWQSPASEDPA